MSEYNFHLDALNCLAATAGEIHETEKKTQSSTKIEEKGGRATIINTTVEELEIGGNEDKRGKPSFYNKVHSDLESRNYTSFLDEIRSSNTNNPDNDGIQELFESYLNSSRATTSSAFVRNPFSNNQLKPPNFSLGNFLNKSSETNSTASQIASTNTFKSIYGYPNSYLPSQFSESYLKHQWPQSYSQTEYQKFLTSMPTDYQSAPNLFKNQFLDTNNNSNNATTTNNNNNNNNSSDNSSLFSTLVEESQKILSTKEKKKMQEKLQLQNAAMEENIKSHLALMNKDNDSIISDTKSESSESSVVKKTPRKPKKPVKKNIDLKKNMGPPFTPGHLPPKANTPESALCTLFEHTLLKMATRGFWSGDRGPFQDIFRLARVESLDLQYSMRQITEHCYNIIKDRLLAAEEDKSTLLQHMNSYVVEFDDYLERIFPVTLVAINIYLPTAADYSVATWHGIVPTGWSEYRRAVVIREVFEVLHRLMQKYDEIPNYSSEFFDNFERDPLLLPIPFLRRETEDVLPKAKPEDSLTKGKKNNENENIKDVVETDNNISSELNKEKAEVKHSLAFQALWTKTSPEQSVIIMDENTELSLGGYLELYPLEIHSPSDNVLIKIANKKYRAKTVLGYFRRGVQLVDYSKENGNLVDTKSTIKNISVTSAIRKIPPGKISKLIHTDLHLDNYTNTIVEVGNEKNDKDFVISSLKHTRTRKRKIKSISDTNNVSVKNKKTSKTKLENEIIKTEKKEQDLLYPFSNDLFNNNTNFDSTKNDLKNLNTFDTNFVPPSHRIRDRIPTDHHFDLMAGPATPQAMSPKIQTFPGIPPVPPFSSSTPDILSSMQFPSPHGNSELFSLHIMIDSYRRAAKYLLDTANHLELVARRTSNYNVPQSNSRSSTPTQSHSSTPHHMSQRGPAAEMQNPAVVAKHPLISSHNLIPSSHSTVKQSFSPARHTIVSSPLTSEQNLLGTAKYASNISKEPLSIPHTVISERFIKKEDDED